MHPFTHPLSLLHRENLRLRKYLHRRTMLLGAAEIVEAIERFGPVEAPALMVHSSLSACGQIEGGAHTVIDVLRAWARAATLAMPTHSYCYPTGNSPSPCFDPAFTPSTVGAITDVFWRQPGVVRSVHPTHSLACAGPLASEICGGHEWTMTPCGRDTPYEKLVQLDCAVLLFGATLDGYTFFHTAEDAARCPYLYESRKYELAFRDRCDLRWSMPSLRQDMTVIRRFAKLDTWLEQRGLLRRGKLGLGELLFIPHAGAAHVELVETMHHEPWLLVADAAHPTGRGPAISLNRTQMSQ